MHLALVDRLSVFVVVWVADLHQGVVVDEPLRLLTRLAEVQVLTHQTAESDTSNRVELALVALVAKVADLELLLVVGGAILDLLVLEQDGLKDPHVVTFNQLDQVPHFEVADSARAKAGEAGPGLEHGALDHEARALAVETHHLLQLFLLRLYRVLLVQRNLEPFFSAGDPAVVSAAGVDGGGLVLHDGVLDDALPPDLLLQVRRQLLRHPFQVLPVLLIQLVDRLLIQPSHSLIILKFFI
eukprot:CAMPEP_0170552800 /NCGR_PEP_ID=MMETSP0211-20121228/10696_1 /TAXON_ID=311385 /ORGANISM="Pseudokeronopsis sp., Strain OXSARD2" /LENGTH=240 /DNA_ID=CAMNT_0010860801 /DNA_START=768 /DNA_END=1490 /DNA_ORIENTATION=+